MSEELKPCPFCAEAPTYYQGGYERYVRCEICLTQGPIAYTDEAAIAAWNQRKLAEEEILFDWLLSKFKISSLKMSGAHHWVFSVSPLPTATSALEAIRAGYRKEQPEEKP